MTIAISIVHASFFSTHHASARDLLSGRERPFTAPSFALLVGRARRFTSLVTQMHIEVCGAVLADGKPLPAVFATREGEIETAGKLIADLHENSMVSSARFALSVHNTASGLFSVATHSTAPTTTVTGANAIAAGWLEAALTALDGGGNVLLSIADEPVPAAFRGPTERVGVAAAFVLGPPSPTGRRAELALTQIDDDDDIRPLHTLARAADAGASDQAATITLGRIQPDATLQLRFVPGQDARVGQ